MFQEKKQNIDFQDGCHSGHLGFPIETILAIYSYLKVNQMFPSKFHVNWPFISEEQRKIYFQGGGQNFQGGYLGLRIGMILANFNLQDTAMLPTKFQVSWPFGSGEEAKNRFSR